MISAFFIITSQGDVLTSRIFREEVKYNITEVFYNKIIKLKNNSALLNPILTIGSTSFIHFFKNDLYYVVITRNNADVSIILEFLKYFVNLLESLINNNQLTNLDIMDNILLVYELLNKLIDQGYIRRTDISKSLNLLPIVKSQRNGFDYLTSILQDSNELNIMFKLKPEEMLKGMILQNTEYLNFDAIKKTFHLFGELVINGDGRDIRVNLGSLKQIDEIIIAPNIGFVDNRDDNNNIVVGSSNGMRNLLNYSKAMSYMNKLPILITGKYHKMNEKQVNIDIELKYDISFVNHIHDLEIQIPIPEAKNIDIADIDNDYKQEDGYLIIDIKKATSVSASVDTDVNISKWLINRHNSKVSYILKNKVISDFKVNNFYTIQEEGDCVFKSQCVVDYELFI